MWLSDHDYYFIYDKVPRLAVDVVIKREGKIVLIKRGIEPYLHFWHIPGGTLYKDESVIEAAIRIAKSETGLDVEFVKLLGFMEFPEEKRGDITMKTVSLAVEVETASGELTHDENAEDIAWFDDFTDPMDQTQKMFLIEHKIIAK